MAMFWSCERTIYFKERNLGPTDAHMRVLSEKCDDQLFNPLPIHLRGVASQITSRQVITVFLKKTSQSRRT